MSGALHDTSSASHADRNEPHGRWQVVVPEPELDPSSSPALHDRIHQLIDDHVECIAVDWRNVTFADSSAIGVLVKAQHRLEQSGGELTVICEAGRGRRLFELTGLDQALRFAASPADLG